MHTYIKVTNQIKNKNPHCLCNVNAVSVTVHSLTVQMQIQCLHMCSANTVPSLLFSQVFAFSYIYIYIYILCCMLKVSESIFATHILQMFLYSHH